MFFFWKRNQGQKNRRKKDRVSFRQAIKLLVPSLACTRGEGYVEVKGRNLSEGGILIKVNRSYPTLVPCRLKIETIDHPQSLTLEGMIVWADENKNEGLWDVGINFVNLREEDRNFLKSLIQHTS